MRAISTKRRRLRFTLSSLLLLLTLICVALSWLVRVWAQQEIISQVEQTGGRVYYSYQVAHERGVFAAPGNDWLRDFYDYVTLVDFDRGYAGDLSPLATLPRLEWLVLSGTSVSDVSVLAELRLKRVDLANTKVVDINALSASTELEWLTLTATQVSDLSPLTGFRHLERVDLSNTEITNLSALAAADNLDWLDISNTPVTEISALSNKRHLRHIDASNTDVHDITALASSSHLDWLDLSGTLVSDVSAFGNSRQLTRFDLSNTYVSDVTSLVNAESLTWAALDNTRITDQSLQDLAAATTLETLLLRNTEITDAGLKQLETLTELRSLDVAGTHVTARGIARFRLARPKCFVGRTPMLGQTPHAEPLFPPEHVPTADEINTKFAQLGVAGSVACDASQAEKPIVLLSLRSSRLSDEVVLSLVNQMPRLARLFVVGGLIGDELVAGIGGKPILYLSLEGTRVTDAGLQYLEALPGLKHLNLSLTRVSDAGLASLERLDNLTTLQLADTRVTRRGITRLRKLLPNCSILWNLDRSRFR